MICVIYFYHNFHRKFSDAYDFTEDNFNIELNYLRKTICLKKIIIFHYINLRYHFNL